MDMPKILSISGADVLLHLEGKKPEYMPANSI
jgi:hypothetical protein